MQLALFERPIDVLIVHLQACLAAASVGARRRRGLQVALREAVRLRMQLDQPRRVPRARFIPGK